MMKRKHGTVKKIICIVLALAAAFAVYAFFALDTPEMTAFKRKLKYRVLFWEIADEEAEAKGLKNGYFVTDYENGIINEGDFDEWQDNVRIYNDGNVSRLVSYYGGYQVDLPADATYDFKYSAGYILASGKGWSVKISREYAPYQSKKEIVNFALDCLFPFMNINRGVEDYISYYEHRFLLSPEWQEANGVKFTDATENKMCLIYHADVSDAPAGEFDGYTYITALKKTREYIRIIYKYNSDDISMRNFITEKSENIRTFDPYGNGHYETDFECVLPDNWSEETKTLYNEISSYDKIKWGIYTSKVETDGINTEIPSLEEKIEHKFDVILDYSHLRLDNKTGEFPLEFMKKAYSENKLVELTYQLTDCNNESLYSRSAFLDVWRGKYDDEIRAYARSAAAFAHPFLFRLCNEPNSDWCSYSGVVNLGDPELYISVWHRIYRIFAEEGVNNAIWIYNPNDRNCPPNIWNDSLAYYPGNGYAQLFGITGYNNGTYYTKWGESWREFEEIYDNIESLSLAHYGDYPWIITEFSSSGIGGDKAAWIDNMFKCIGKYKNIKIAVWFSYADYDGGTPARTYWLDETEKTTEAFKRGINK